MTEADRPPALHHSIFARLVAIMLVMAASLIALVSTFYVAIMLPGLHSSLRQLVGEHVKAIAASAPDSAAAERLAASLDMEIRFEGPGGSWATADDVPTLQELTRRRDRGWIHHLSAPWNAYYVVQSRRGAYVFERTFGERLRVAHHKMVGVLLLIMVAVFVVAYLVMRRALRPLRLLTEGVTRLSEGELDVAVPKPTRDEFGVLTHAFNRMARRVRDMLRARDQLLLDVSHELRSPLTRLKVALALQPEGPTRDSMTADVAEMEAMVAELLELERLRDGGGVRTERQDLLPLLHQVAAGFAGRSPGVRLGAMPAEAPLDFDPDRLRVVFRNLIENAIKFSLPDSGPVEITVERGARATVVRVMDDGPGIPESDRESLFEPFVRLEPSRSKKTGGYGLGLSICKRIVEAHGGTIAVESRSGRGATFVLSFPTPVGAGAS